MALFAKLHTCLAMHANPATGGFEILVLPIGNGWRVRISDGQHLHFVGGFDAEDKANEWVRNASSAWLAKRKKATEHL